MELDKLRQMAEDTVTHKKIVLDNCNLMAKYFFNTGETEKAIQILKRGVDHDNSKFNYIEFKKLASILNSRKCFTNASEQLTDVEMEAIKYHWSHNKHHPEYYYDKEEDMSELDIIEMVCDWFARSLQYNTDFIPFIKERQKNRFKFNEKMFSTVLWYCELILKLYNKENGTNKI